MLVLSVLREKKIYVGSETNWFYPLQRGWHDKYVVLKSCNGLFILEREKPLIMTSQNFLMDDLPNVHAEIQFVGYSNHYKKWRIGITAPPEIPVWRQGFNFTPKEIKETVKPEFWLDGE